MHCVSMPYVDTCSSSAVDLTKYFPHLQAGTKLSEDHLSNLKERLYEETKKIKFNFASFMFDLRKDLEKSLETEDVVEFLVYYNKNLEPLLSNCNSLSDVLKKVRKFVSFFDFDLLEHLCDKFGSDDIKRKLQVYKDYFEAFSKRRVIECPSDAFGECGESEEVLILVADKTIEDLTVDELKKFKYRVNKILGDKLVRVLSVQGGCIIISFETFKMDEFVFTQEQKEALKDEGVTKISRGNQLIYPGT